MRWVNPSIATVSPSRTRSAIASRIDATFELVIAASLRVDLAVVHRARMRGLRDHLGRPRHRSRDSLTEEPDPRRDLVRGDDQRRTDPNGLLAALEDQEAALEGSPL